MVCCFVRCIKVEETGKTEGAALGRYLQYVRYRYFQRKWGEGEGSSGKTDHEVKSPRENFEGRVRGKKFGQEFGTFFGTYKVFSLLTIQSLKKS